MPLRVRGAAIGGIDNPKPAREDMGRKARTPMKKRKAPFAGVRLSTPNLQNGNENGPPAGGPFFCVLAEINAQNNGKREKCRAPDRIGEARARARRTNPRKGVESAAHRRRRKRADSPSPHYSCLKKSLPLSSTRMKAGKFSTSIFQTASIPSSGYSTSSTFLMLSCARIAAGPPMEPR